MKWHKAGASTSRSDNCVENPGAGALRVTPAAFGAFLDGLKRHAALRASLDALLSEIAATIDKDAGLRSISFSGRAREDQ